MNSILFAYEVSLRDGALFFHCREDGGPATRLVGVSTRSVLRAACSHLALDAPSHESTAALACRVHQAVPPGDAVVFIVDELPDLDGIAGDLSEAGLETQRAPLTAPAAPAPAPPSQDEPALATTLVGWHNEVEVWLEVPEKGTQVIDLCTHSGRSALVVAKEQTVGQFRRLTCSPKGTPHDELRRALLCPFTRALPTELTVEIDELVGTLILHWPARPPKTTQLDRRAPRSGR